MKPVIAITTGDPSGIGPEIVEMALSSSEIKAMANFRVFGKLRWKHLPAQKAGEISLQSLTEAVEAIQKGECDLLVTAPVSKKHLQMAKFRFPGQTEFLAHAFQIKQVAMMLASPRLKVVLVTIHLPLRKVFDHLSIEKILEKILLAHHALQQDFHIEQPRIAVCGLNPHAGEEGLMGSEEKRWVVPAIRRAQKKNREVSGPYPADTVFHLACQGRFDAVICHYHDQGLIPLKTLDFHEGVNVTLGLPIVRTSPDHGCAFDIAGKGIANPQSLMAAIQLGCTIWKNRRKSCEEKI